MKSIWLGAGTGALLAVVGCLGTLVAQAAIPGHVGLGFDPGSGATFPAPGGTAEFGPVRALAQSTGRVVVWGGFEAFGGVGAPGLTRLETNGQPDATFRLPLFASVSGLATNPASIRDVGRLADDRLLAVGSFNSVNGVVRSEVPAGWDNLVRLTANGEADPDYRLDFDQLALGGVYPGFSLRLLETRDDGSAVVSVRLDSGLSITENIYLLGTNGTVVGDGLAALAGPDGEGTYVAAASTPDDHIVSVQQISGAGLPTPRLERFSGFIIDQTFRSPAFINAVERDGSAAPATVNVIKVLPDGRILVGGSFTHVDGFPRGGVVRLLANGTVDPSFVPGTAGKGTLYTVAAPPFPTTNGPVTALLPRPDGTLIVGGDFSFFDDQPRAGLVRLRDGGGVDSTFATVPGVGRLAASQAAAFARVSSLHAIDTNQVLIAGLFDSINNVSRAQVAWVQDGPGDIRISVSVAPTNISIRPGLPLLLTATAEGDSPLNYIWARNGEIIPGATNYFLYVPAVGAVDDGLYQAYVASPPWGWLSDGVRVIVELPVPARVAMQPTPRFQRAFVGESATITVAGAGDSPLSYFWYFQGMPLADATNSTLTLTNLVEANAGFYAVLITNIHGVAGSEGSVLAVYDRARPDTDRPVVTVSNVPHGERVVYQPVFPLQGSATDGYYVDLVIVDEQGSNRVVNYLGESPWTVPLALGIGTNRFKVYGHDLAGNYSPTNDITLIYEIDTTPPLVVVKSHAGVTNVTDDDRPILSGTVTDQDVARIYVSLRGGFPQQVAILGGTNWSRELWLVPGTNRVQVFADDPSGNRTATNDVVLIYVPKAIFRVTTVGQGTIQGLTNRQSLIAGRRYTVTATPKAGWLFRGWSGTYRTNGASLTFTASSNQVVRVTAEFVTNRFPAWKGTYAGVVYGPGVPSISSLGDASVTLSDRGALSGRLRSEGGTYTVTGTLDPATWETVVTLLRPRTNAIHLAVRLDPSVAGLRLVVTNRDLVMPALLVRPLYTATQPVPTNLVGTYTMALRADDSQSMGFGYASLTVARAGAVSVSGVLGDGTTFSLAGTLDSTNGFSGFNPLFAGKGAVLLAVDLPTVLHHGMTGMLAAVRPAGQAGNFYRGGFAIEAALIGGRYVAPKTGFRALSFSNAVIALEGGNLPTPIIGVEATLTTANKVVVAGSNTNRTALTVTPTTGLFSGTFLHPVTRKTAAIKGAMLQGRAVGAGFFPGTNVTGKVYFGAPEKFPLEP